MLRSLPSALTHTQNSPVTVRVKKILSKFHQGALTIRRIPWAPVIIYFFIFVVIALKLEKSWPAFFSLNPCPSLQSAETDDGKQFQCLTI